MPPSWGPQACFWGCVAGNDGHTGPVRAAGPTIQEELAASLPSPIGQFPLLGTACAQLWYKDDGRCGTSYGGNKLRKLGPLLDRAVRRGQRRILTFGSVGSHHVLATALYGARAGLDVEAVVFGQPESPHVVEVLRAIVGCGARLHPADSYAAAERIARAVASPRTTLISPGPMGALACIGYADAVHELNQQIRRGLLPVPDRIVVPSGSGATAAGILVGLQECGLPSKLLAVAIAPNPAMRPLILLQALRTAKYRGLQAGFEPLSARLEVTADYLGRGYGRPTRAGAEAAADAAAVGLKLELTYTAKAFAAALELSKEARHRSGHVLFWQTVSQFSMTALLDGAPARGELPAELQNKLLKMPKDAPFDAPPTACSQ
jgi:1-aminocyclopropane-1-carboxylate deaminase/D-cysteine desulfhydrase-like pyridoxal-dependent ACC family enzyme